MKKSALLLLMLFSLNPYSEDLKRELEIKEKNKQNELYQKQNFIDSADIYYFEGFSSWQQYDGVFAVKNNEFYLISNSGNKILKLKSRFDNKSKSFIINNYIDSNVYCKDKSYKTVLNRTYQIYGLSKDYSHNLELYVKDVYLYPSYKFSSKAEKNAVYKEIDNLNKIINDPNRNKFINSQTKHGITIYKHCPYFNKEMIFDPQYSTTYPSCEVMTGLYNSTKEQENNRSDEHLYNQPFYPQTQENAQSNEDINKEPVSLLYNPLPKYPLSSRRNGEQGRVILKVLVSKQGICENIEVDTSSGFESLDKAAIETVKRWKFKRARENNIPINKSVLIPVKFSVNGENTESNDNIN